MKYPSKTLRTLIGTGLSSLFLIAVFPGCESLDFADPNSPVLENASLQTLVTGAEAGMRVDLAIYLRDVAVVGREAYYFEPADPRYTGELLKDAVDPGGFLLTRPWSARYNVIKNCNLVMEKAVADLTGEALAGADGFARTIMAYQLLLNLNLLNENGVKLDYTGDLSIPFATKTESFAEIESLLDEAYSDLGNAGSAFGFKLSSGFDGFDTPATFALFNRALKVRVAVYQSEWQEALDALDDSFVDEAAALDLGVYHVYSTAANDQTNGIYENPEAAFVKLMGHPTFETDADSGDTRYSNKVFTRDEATTFDFLTSSLGIIVTTSSTDPLTIIRNEELILLRAEANIGLGNFSAAQADIDVVRAAAGLASVTLTADNALSQLLHEKRYSLFLEGHRWVDMRRYDKLNDLPLDRDDDAHIISFPRPETEVEG